MSMGNDLRFVSGGFLTTLRNFVPLSAPNNVPLSAPNNVPLSAPNNVPLSAPNNLPLSAPNNVPLSYDRPLHPAGRRPSPTPGPSNGFDFYDRYTPTDSSPGYRENYANGFAPNSWRPDRPFPTQTPSPERFVQQRDIQTDSWVQPPSWDPPESATWSERREPRPSLYDSPLPRGRRETMAERMFVPSDTWKQSHNDFGSQSDGGRDRPIDLDWRARSPQKSVVDHYSPPHNHYSPPRNSYSPPRNHYSPEGDDYTPLEDPYSPTRDHYPPLRERYSSSPSLAGDRFRPRSPSLSYEPYSPRFPYMNPGSDSYRPQYEEDSTANWAMRAPDNAPKQKGRRRGGRKRFQHRNQNRSNSINSAQGLPLSSPVSTQANVPERLISPTSMRSASNIAPLFARPAKPPGVGQPPLKKRRSRSPSPPPPPPSLPPAPLSLPPAPLSLPRLSPSLPPPPPPPTSLPPPLPPAAAKAPPFPKSMPRVVSKAAPRFVPISASRVVPKAEPQFVPESTPRVVPKAMPCFVPISAPKVLANVAKTAPQSAPISAPRALANFAKAAPQVISASVPRALANVAKAAPQLGPASTPKVVSKGAPQFVPASTPKIVSKAAPQFVPASTPQVVPKAAPQLVPASAPKVIPQAAPQFVPASAPRGPASAPRVLANVANAALQFVPTSAPRVVFSKTAPRITLKVAPEYSPESASKAAPEAAPRFVPESKPKVVPTAVPDLPGAVPKAFPEAASKAIAEAASKVVPENTSKAVAEAVVEIHDGVTDNNDYDSLASTPHDDVHTPDFPAVPIEEVSAKLSAVKLAPSATVGLDGLAERRDVAENLPVSRHLKITTSAKKVPEEMPPEAGSQDSKPSSRRLAVVTGPENSPKKTIGSEPRDNASLVADSSDMDMSEPASPAAGSTTGEDEFGTPELSPAPVPPPRTQNLRSADDSRMSVESDMEMSLPPSPSDRIRSADGAESPLPGRNDAARELTASPFPRKLSRSEAEDAELYQEFTAALVATKSDYPSGLPEDSDKRDAVEDMDIDMEISTPASPAHRTPLRAPSVASSTAVGEEIPGLHILLPTPQLPHAEYTKERAMSPFDVSSSAAQILSEKIAVVDTSPVAVSPPPELETPTTATVELQDVTGPKAPATVPVVPELAPEVEATVGSQSDTVTPTTPAIFGTPASVATPASAATLVTTHIAAAQIQQIDEGPGAPQEKDEVAAHAIGERPLSEALRLVVLMRLKRDRQTRESRIHPTLINNLSMVEAPQPQLSSLLSPDVIITKIYEGEHRRAREASFARTRPSLEQWFAQRQAALTTKVQNLRGEYISLHERWMAHCAKLDEVAKAVALEEAAATAGRTTRRTAALTDAVRSDLEMEQIIASLGNEELTDATHLGSKNAATIPNMISVTNGSVDFLFDDANNRVDDPTEFYAPRTGMDDWSEEEKAIFLEKWVVYPKQFGLIADYLPHKTAAQCVTYYYLHKHTLIDFREVLSRHASNKRKRGGKRADKKKGNALLTDIRKHDAEVSRDSTPGASTTRRKRGAQATNTETKRSSRRNSAQVEQSPISTPTPDPDPEPRRRRRQPKPTARAIALMEQERQQSAEPSVEPEPKPRRGRKSRKVVKSAEIVVSGPEDDIPSVSNETKFIDQTDLSTRKKPIPGGVNWSEEDKALFLKLLAQYGDDFKRIAASMPNKTTIQVSQFFKANQAELALAKVAASAPKRSPTPDVPQDTWQETSGSIPGSGILTPNTNSSTPELQLPMQGLPPVAIETRFRVNGHGSSSNRLHIQEVFASSDRDLKQESSAPGQPSGGYQFRSTSIESIRAQYSLDLPSRAFPSIQPRTSRLADGSILSRPPNANGSLMDNTINGTNASPATLTTTFQSNFSYSNLSPSHFANDSRPIQRLATRNVSPPGAASSSTMTFDATMFAQQAWTNRSLSGPAPALPATLQTTEDLVAYLEHRTRQTAQQLDFP